MQHDKIFRFVQFYHWYRSTFGLHRFYMIFIYISSLAFFFLFTFKTAALFPLTPITINTLSAYFSPNLLLHYSNNRENVRQYFTSNQFEYFFFFFSKLFWTLLVSPCCVPFIRFQAAMKITFSCFRCCLRFSWIHDSNNLWSGTLELEYNFIWL